MEVIKSQEDGKAVISVNGEIDSANVADFEEKLKNAVEGENTVVMDLADLEYVSSAGLRVFLMIQKMYGSGDGLTIINTNDEVMEIFKVTGFSKLLNLR